MQARMVNKRLRRLSTMRIAARFGSHAFSLPIKACGHGIASIFIKAI
jgi:hypothetical protein